MATRRESQLADLSARQQALNGELVAEVARLTALLAERDAEIARLRRVMSGRDGDAAWEDASDDVFDVVADLDPPSARIAYAFKVGYCAALAARAGGEEA